jgi:uncharacterized protein YebE (UPF0316 family)
VIAAWAIGALVIFVASFVMGLAGFGIALVAMAFLPWVMSPVTAVVLLTIYALLFSIVVVVPLRREVTPRPALNRLIGAVLVAVVALELFSALPSRLPGRGWGSAPGFFPGWSVARWGRRGHRSSSTRRRRDGARARSRPT